MSQHYIFTHEVLRDAALQSGVEIFKDLDAGFGNILNSRINELLLMTDARAGLLARRFDAEDIRVSFKVIGSAPCFILAMPPPEEITEAYFIAIVSRIPVFAVQAQNRGESFGELPGTNAGECSINYYTLERSSVREGKVKTRFCEWSKSGHYNYCTGPSPTEECFGRILEGVVLARAAGEGRTAVADDARVPSSEILDRLPLISMFWSGETHESSQNQIKPI